MLPCIEVKRLEKEEIWALFEVIWTRNDKDMKIWSFGNGRRCQEEWGRRGFVQGERKCSIYNQERSVIDYNSW